MDTKNLSCVRRDDKYWVLVFTDENGTAIDITGWTIFFTAKNDIDDVDADAIIKKDITSHTDPTAGTTQIHLTPTDTNLLGIYVYDIQVKKLNGDILTVVNGELTFLDDVTIRTA